MLSGNSVISPSVQASTQADRLEESLQLPVKEVKTTSFISGSANDTMNSKCTVLRNQFSLGETRSYNETDGDLWTDVYEKNFFSEILAVALLKCLVYRDILSRSTRLQNELQ